MLIDRPEVTETSQIINATVDSGTSNPDNPDVGQLFFRTDLNAMVVYNGTGWVEAGAVGLATHATDEALHLTTGQNALLDGLASTLTAAELNFVDGVTSSIQGQLDAQASSLTGHVSDAAVHLTAAQNTLLDGLNLPTLTAAEVNRLVGVTSPIQQQLNDIVGVNSQQDVTLGSLQAQINSNLSGASGALASHAGDSALHLTAAQNTLLDGLNLPTLTAAEVNRLVGVTDDIQSQFNTINSNRLHRDGSIALTGNLAMGTNRITGLGEPVSADDAATRAYVDSLVQGLSWKQAVRVSTTPAGGDIPLSGLTSVDGVTVSTNDRVLVKNQTNAAQNGIYLASASAWSRAPDANTAAELENAAVFVREGSVHADSAWVQVQPVTTLGTSPLSFTQFAAAGGLAEGQGIQITGAVISARLGSGLTFSGSSITLDTSADFSVTSTTLELAATPSATAGTYGSGTDIPVITTDGRGRVTGISSASLTGTFQPTSANLTSLAGLSTIGVVVRTSSNTFTTRSLSVTGTGLSITNADGSSGGPTIASNATASSSAGAIVARDSSGNFSAGTITANLSGNASTATALQTGRSINGVSFDGTADISVNLNSSVTFNGSGAGATSGSTFNGATALTVSHNTIGAPSTTGAGASGTWGISITGNAATVGGAALSTLLRSNIPQQGGLTYDAHDFNSYPNLYSSTFINTGASTNAPVQLGGGQAYRFIMGAGDVSSRGFDLVGYENGLLIRERSNGAWRAVLHQNNFNSFAPTLTGTGASGTWDISITGNAATVGGLSVTSSATGNTVAARDASGYMFATYFNQSSVDGENGTVSQVMVTNGVDNYLRKASIAHLTSSLSGTAPINISGSAATLGGNAETTYLRYRGTINEADVNSARTPGIYTLQRTGFSEMLVDIVGEGSTPRLQLVANYGEELYFRAARDLQTEWDGLAYPGRRLLHDSNYNSYAPTLTGGGASGTWNITSSRVTVTASAANSTYYLLWHSGNDVYNNSAATAAAQVYLNPSNGQLNVGSLVASGDVTAFSDARVKRSVQPIQNALEKVAQLNGVTFTRCDLEDKERRHAGVIAQEVEKVLPEVVSESSDGLKGVAYGNMVSLLIEAVKELKAEVDELKKSRS